MNKYAASNGDSVNVLLLNIEGVKKAQNFKTGQLNDVIHGGIKEVPDEFGLAYIPHHVIVGTDGNVIVNYDNFSFDKVPKAESTIFAAAAATAEAAPKTAASVSISIQWCGG